MQTEADSGPPTVSSEQVKQRLDDGEPITILDTRDSASFEAWHIEHPNATVHNIPATAFRNGAIPSDVPEGPIVTCCAKGISSLMVAEQLYEAGYEVASIDNGMEGWATLYESYELPHDEATVVQFHRPSSGCLSYMIISEGEAAVVDPLHFFTDKYVSTASNHDASITAVLDTHIHADHVSGGTRLAEEVGAEYYLPKQAVERGLECEATLLDDGETVSVGSISLKREALVGHTSEMSGYRLGRLLFSGDTVFAGQVARPDLEHSDEATAAAFDLYDTIQRLLARQTTLAPGHTSDPIMESHTFQSTELVDHIPLLQQSRDDFAKTVGNTTAPRPEAYQQIIAINLGQRTVNADEAFSLELGPNNCAA